MSLDNTKIEPSLLLHLLINDYNTNCDDIYMNNIKEKQRDKLYKDLKKQLIINRNHSSIIRCKNVWYRCYVQSRI